MNLFRDLTWAWLRCACIGGVLVAGCVEANPDFVEVTATDDGNDASTGTTPMLESGPVADDTTSVGMDADGSTSRPADTTDTTSGNCDAEEICDGQDNNCDGQIDEGCPCEDGVTEPCYDGPRGTADVGACASGTRVCNGGRWGICVGSITPGRESCNAIDDDCDGDVDDGLGTMTCGIGICMVMVDLCLDGVLDEECVPGLPAPAEECNGLDDDCNGLVDDGIDCACVVGTQYPCYTGSPETLGVGQCTAGTQTCVDGESFGPCMGAVLPQAEQCDGLDNDCDGDEDEDDPGGGGPCQTGLPGVCSIGTAACVGGSITCNQNTQSSNEVCDGLDNNCNSGTDEGNPGGGLPCNVPNQQGPCAQGQTLCQAGTIVCTQTVFPMIEVCDGINNDCDNQTDEQNPGGGQPCNVAGQQGACANGTTNCTGGNLVCTQTVNPSNEVCNGIDDDCDGMVDEGVTGGGLPCSTGLFGVCGQGTSSCAGGMSTCSQTTQPSAEICDGLDNDCDGPVDENNPGGGAACPTGQPGVCGQGTTTCTQGTLQCVANNMGQAETCDGVDNDCDGAVDEGNPGGGVNCMTGLQGVCAAGTTQCTGGAIVCQQNQQASTEICDAFDNNCNGQNNENNPGGGQPCATGAPGVCSAGTTACQNNAIVCNQNTQSSAEVCDGLDNDCDALIDEGNPGGGGSCMTGQPGVCGSGTLVCTAGNLLCQANQQPSTEVCDGVDNNCNGTVDEGCQTGCAHSLCVANQGPLASGCSPCVTQVCNADAYCCSVQWDIICVHEAATICGCGNCAFPPSCTHSLCATGPPLASNCDDWNGPGSQAALDCVQQVCNANASCCSTSWTATCVGLVGSVCGLSCSCP